MPMPLCQKITLTLLALLMAPNAWGEPLWKRFAPVDRVESRVDGDYTINQQSGPWLVMAATFSGEGSEEQAHELAVELREHFNLPAYTHSMTFNFSSDGDRIGRGIDRYGAPIRKRYRMGDHNQEFAVLVGDFSAIDDPHAQKQLDRIKKLRPKALERAHKETTQNLAQEREFLTRMQGSRGAPPMRKAFLTRNPVLPKEFFRPKGVDKFVTQMNRGVENSLLDCPGRYTVKIATFRGKGILMGSFKSNTSQGHKKSKPKVDPLTEAAENAHNITVFLRARGWDAYEFHDRTESYVTIGSYEQVAQRLANGQVTPTREVGIVIQTFGAAYQTPAALSVGKNVPMQDRVRAEEVKQKFNNLFSNQQGQIAQGLQPKYIEYQKNKFVTLDIHPHAIEAPKRSITSAYAWGR